MTPLRTLEAILADAPEVRVRRRVGDLGAVVSGITHDSRRVQPGWVYCCVRGERADGHDYAVEAVAAGASALLAEREVPLGVPQVLVDDSRSAMGPLASAVHGHPSRHVTVIGVTGTNGKTTTTHLLGSVLERAGRPTGLLGTLSGSHTTPEAPDLQATLAGYLQAGKAAVAMEVSSHALALHRVDGTHFAVAVFTNLGRDHLDFHGTVERYFAAKARLFEPALASVGVVNGDDPHGQLLADAAEIPMTVFTMADATDLRIGPAGSRFRWRGHQVTLPMGGAFNVENALAAATAASLVGVDDADIVAGLGASPPVPGRFEPVDAGQPFTVLVDYAHTPDGLDAVLLAARNSAAGGRLLVVFGCGGDRDHAKRPAMGARAAQHADMVVVTSDNPRSEDPAAIIETVISGVPSDTGAEVVVESDRRAAIELAVRAARPGDVLVIAGKGHETTQALADRVVPFDDRAVAREAIGALG